MVNSNPTPEQAKAAKAAGTWFDGKVYASAESARAAQRAKTLSAGYGSPSRGGGRGGRGGRGRGGSSRGGGSPFSGRGGGSSPPRQKSVAQTQQSAGGTSRAPSLPSSMFAGDISDGIIHHSRLEVKTDVSSVVRVAQLESFINKMMEDCTAFAVLDFNFALRCFLVNGGAFSGTVTFGWWHGSLSKAPPTTVSEILDLPGNRTLPLTAEMSFRPPAWARVIWKRADNVAIEHCIPQLLMSFSCAGVPSPAVPLASGRWELKVRQSRMLE